MNAMITEKLWVRVADAVCAASLHKQQTELPKLIGEFCNLQTSKRERIRCGLNLAGKFIPGLEDQILRFFINTDTFTLPFSSESLQVIDRGGEHVVFLVKNNGEDKVLKVNKTSIGRKTGQLEKIAELVTHDYHEISQWYAGIPGFVPEEQFVIFNSPFGKRNAFGVLQPFIKGKIKCLFEEYGETDLLDGAKNDPVLRSQIIAVCSQISDQYKRTGISPDILGKRNLAIVENQEHERLLLLDPHVIYNRDSLREEGRYDYIQLLDEKIKYLSHILACCRREKEVQGPQRLVFTGADLRS